MRFLKTVRAHRVARRKIQIKAKRSRADREKTSEHRTNLPDFQFVGHRLVEAGGRRREINRVAILRLFKFCKQKPKRRVINMKAEIT